jgi:hypothetical protein
MKQVEVVSLGSIGNVEPRFLNLKAKDATVEIKSEEPLLCYDNRRAIEGRVSEVRLGGEFTLDTSA